MAQQLFDPKGNLLVGDSTSLAELVFNSLFCNRSAGIGDSLGGGQKATYASDRGGWWADPNFGSKLWLIMKTGKLLPNTPELAKQYIVAALQNLKTAGVLGEIEVTVEATGSPKSALTATIVMHKPDGSVETIKYESLWDNVGGGN